MRAGCGANDTASMPGRDRFVMYIPTEWTALDSNCRHSDGRVRNVWYWRI